MISYLDGRVMVWPNALSEQNCDVLETQIVWPKHGPARVPSVAKNLGDMCLAAMGADAPELVWLDWVTYTMKSTGWHRDEIFGDETHKLCLYLDDSGVGTIFRGRGDGVIAPLCSRGTIVLFDIGLEHATGPGAVEERRVLGLRARVSR